MNLLRKLWNLPALPASLLLLGTLLVFVPTVIYQGNQPFFPVSLAGMFAYLVPAWLALSLLVALPSAGESTRGRRLFTQLLTTVAVAGWANATFAIGTKGMLDGTNFEVVRGYTALYQNTLAVGLALLVVFFAAGRFAKPVRAFVFLLVGLVTINTVYGLVTIGGPSQTASVDTSRFRAFSRTSNLLVVLMDTFQSDLFAEMLEKEPNLATSLDGFTYFPDTAGVAPTTYVAIPPMHSGLAWDTTTPLPEFYARAVGQNSFLNAIAYSGFDVSLVHPVFRMCPKEVTCFNLPDVAFGSSSSALQSATELVDIALLRMSPHLLKPLVFRDGEWLLSGISLLRSMDAHQSNMALDVLANSVAVHSDKPTVKFLHLFNTHPPARFTAACEYSGRTTWSRDTAGGQARCAMTHVIGLLKEMKRAGIYDQTAIVLTADHGSYLPRDGVPSMAVRANPLFMIKPQKASGPLRTSSVQASLADLPATSCALTKACTWPNGADLFTLQPGTTRSRPFVDYVWQPHYWKQGLFPVNGRYDIRGPVLSADSWNPAHSTRTQAVHAVAFDQKDPTEIFGPGWSAPSARAPRWTEASGASLSVDTVPGGSGKVTATVSTHPGNPDQRIEVFAAGQRVFQGAVSPKAPQDISFQLPGAAMRSGQIALRFRFSQWNPAQIHRKLGPAAVAFHRLEVH